MLPEQMNQRESCAQIANPGNRGYREPLPSISTRKISMKSRTSCRGFIPVWLPSEQWWRRIVFESYLELMFIQLILARGNVYDIWE